ncbi:MAG: C40 family peptidase [Candidatus Aminicenantes bacterium]|nr:C40 family peptidase [Candidatus Aminicenantes bacterium]
MITTTAGRRAGPRRWLPLLWLLCAVSAPSVDARTPDRDVLRRQVVFLARSLVGIPYVYGGTDIDGFDCSGLVHYVYDCFGIRLPRSAREQARLPHKVRLRSARAGDILVFRLKRAWHSAIFLGGRRFVHAPSAPGRVRVEELGGYWLSRLEAVVSILGRG